MRVLLTGGNGLLGSAIRRLAPVLTPENELLSPSRPEVDLLCVDSVEGFVRVTRPDAVIHCAGKVGGILANVSDPVGYLFENAQLNLNVIRTCARVGVRKLAYIGSSCMYPKDLNRPLAENDLLDGRPEPTNEGYALAKIVGAKLCEYYARQHGLHYRTLIPCNLYGPGERFDAVRSHLVAASLVKSHAAKTSSQPAIEIWGDGSSRREFLYVDDFASFVLQSLERLETFPDYLNTGFGEDFSVLDYYKIAMQVTGYEGKFTFDMNKPSGMASKLLDSTKASAYGWQPTTSHIEGMARTYEYYLSTLNSTGRQAA